MHQADRVHGGERATQGNAVERGLAPVPGAELRDELFERGARDRPDDLERALRGISLEAGRMGELVEELLLLAHLDEGRPLVKAARDLGPRLFAVVAGFTNNGLTDGTGVWLPPVIGPIVGGLLGAFAYDLFIGNALLEAHAISESDRPSGRDPSHREPK